MKNTINSIPFSDTRITGGFWKEKQDLIKSTTAMSVYERFKETHRFAALECTWKEGEPNMPHIFWDSDIAKWIEGVAYILSQEENTELEALAEAAIENILKNSDENGYFNSHYLVTEKDKRFTDRRCHELYCAGHLMEAAIAYFEATGKDSFLKAMCRYADYIEKVFKLEGSAAFVTPGHPELELALVKLYHATGEKRYLELSKFFIDEHGTNEKDFENDSTVKFANTMYNQDDMPLRDRSTADGHSVRALYLLSSMADIALEYQDEALKAACERCFENIVNKRMYITGGVGSTRFGETFTIDYHLPNRTAYAETCAAIALAMFSRRMQKLTVDARYADTVERALYNGMLSGISMDGKAFFYENPLEIDPEFNDYTPSRQPDLKERFAITERVEVFNCSCCPPNLLRMIASIGDYLYTYDEETLYVHQYMTSETHFAEKDSDTISAEPQSIRITQMTNYPADGSIRIDCTSTKKYIAVRIPGWCKNFTINREYELKNGYAYIKMDGDCSILLNLEMPVTLIAANRRVHDDAGRIAVTRGPIIYCIEGIDNGQDLKSIIIDVDGTYDMQDSDFLLPALTTKAYRPKTFSSLYAPADDTLEEFTLKLIPFYAFANRGTSEMLVWLLRRYK